MGKILIHQANIVNEGSIFCGSVLIEGERIAKIYKESDPIEESVRSSAEIIEAKDKYLLPGLIDTHVHFREPGLTQKGDISSESKAAIAGGVTSYFDMPNTCPQTIDEESWKAKMQIAENRSWANYAFYIGATHENIESLSALDYSRICGVKLFMGSSTGNMLVKDTKALERLFDTVPSLIAAHCESEEVIRRNKESLLNRYGGNLPISFHSQIRDAEACYQSSSEAVALANRYGTRLHLLHISTAKELSLLEDKPLSEKKITAETCPHYLWFDSSDYALHGAAVKCNPAIKTQADRDALRKALPTQRIDVLSTDHAPHRWEEKQGNCLQAASGCPSVQFSLLLLMEAVLQNWLSLPQMVEKACHAPACLFRIEQRGYIREQYYADLVLLTPCEAWTLTKDVIVSPCAWSPYIGQSFHYKVEKTFLNGSLAYDKGCFSDKTLAKALRFNLF